MWSGANIIEVSLLAEPVTRAWVIYSDIFGSTYAFDMLFHLVDPYFFGGAVAVVTAFVGLTRLFGFGLTRIAHVRALPLVAISVPALAALVILGVGAQTESTPRGKGLSATIAFATSLFASSSYETNFGTADAEQLLPPELSKSTPVPCPDTRNAPIRSHQT